MNFEQLLKFFIKNYSSIKKKKLFFNILKNSYLNLKLKKQKLKLGLIVFEVKEHKIPGTSFLLFETIDIRFIRQDNTEEDEQKFENRLNKLNIKRKKILFFFFIFMFFIFIYLLINHFIYIIETEYISLNLKKEILSVIIRSLFDLDTLKSSNHFFSSLNNFLIDSVINLSITYNFII